MLIRRLLAAVVLVAALWGCGPPKTRALITHRADLRWPAPPQAARIRYLGQVRGPRQQQGVADVVAGQAPGKWLARPYGVTTTPAGASRANASAVATDRVQIVSGVVARG